MVCTLAHQIRIRIHLPGCLALEAGTRGKIELLPGDVLLMHEAALGPVFVGPAKQVAALVGQHLMI